MKRFSLIAALASVFALTSLAGTSALAQSKGGSRDSGGASKSDQNRDPVHNKSREPAPSKSDRRESGRSGSKSRR